MAFDLVIKNGTVVDGSGMARFREKVSPFRMTTKWPDGDNKSGKGLF